MMERGTLFCCSLFAAVACVRAAVRAADARSPLMPSDLPAWRPIPGDLFPYGALMYIAIVRLYALVAATYLTRQPVMCFRFHAAYHGAIVVPGIPTCGACLLQILLCQPWVGNGR